MLELESIQMGCKTSYILSDILDHLIYNYTNLR